MMQLYLKMGVRNYLLFGLVSGFIAAIFEASAFYIFDALSGISIGIQFTDIGIKLFHFYGITAQASGLLMHFLVGTVVGFFAALISFYVKPFNIFNSRKGFLIGLLAGFLILILFSLPVNIFLLHLYVYENYHRASTLFYYSMHIFFGMVWGIFLGLINKKYFHK